MNRWLLCHLVDINLIKIRAFIKNVTHIDKQTNYHLANQEV